MSDYLAQIAGEAKERGMSIMQLCEHRKEVKAVLRKHNIPFDNEASTRALEDAKSSVN